LQETMLHCIIFKEDFIFVFVFVFVALFWFQKFVILTNPVLVHGRMLIRQIAMPNIS
jgi:hypothetical protein